MGVGGGADGDGAVALPKASAARPACGQASSPAISPGFSHLCKGESSPRPQSDHGPLGRGKQGVRGRSGDHAGVRSYPSRR